LLVSLTPALAQPIDSGLEVRVNPAAARPGATTLLYPGGEYLRNVPALLYPGERGGAIHLHMPSKHRAVRAAAPKPRVAKAAPPPAPAPAPATPPPAHVTANPYTAAPDYSNIFGQPAPQQQAARPAPAPKVASAAPPPASKPESEAGLTKRSVILFAKDATDPAEGALGAIKFLAGDLNSAMTRASSRVELQAYGGDKGDKGSDARRLSLKRALAIRAVLIQDGVSADRIDVRAMGGADDSGPADRVDVYVRA
jgi:outer membrane protein OmpA-like peptidoglycan-associated protein